MKEIYEMVTGIRADREQSHTTSHNKRIEWKSIKLSFGRFKTQGSNFFSLKQNSMQNKLVVMIIKMRMGYKKNQSPLGDKPIENYYAVVQKEISSLELLAATGYTLERIDLYV